ncbi:Rrf2 family transcriptional regulator [Scytonema sp. NUACC21]
MEIKNKYKYALLALLALTKTYPSSEPVQIEEIATLQNVPSRYLQTLLAALRSKGLIKSIRGVNGGYILAVDPRTTTLLDALNCIEELDSVTSVEYTSVKTVERNLVRVLWQEAATAGLSVLQKYTLQDLYERQAIRNAVPMYYI